MKLEDTIDFAKLGWVKRELDEALARARRALGRFVDAPDSSDLVRACIDELHQVHGTLYMLELYAVAAVVAEMEQLADTLPDGGQGRVEDTCTALIRGMLQIPDYLERVQSGQRAAPVVLLPLLNELRTRRGRAELAEADFFWPSLDVVLPVTVPGSGTILPSADQKRHVAGLRRRFQNALLSWLRGRDGGEALETMRGVLDSLAGSCLRLAGRRLWWIAGGVVDGLSHGALGEPDAEIKRLIGRVDRYIHAFAERGEAALDDDECIALQRRLLYAVAHAGRGSDRIDELDATFELDRWRPADAELEHARGAMAGRNRQLFETVVQSIKNDLLDVKDGLDLYMRSPQDDPARLAGHAGTLNRIGDTLDVLGWNAPRRLVGEQAEIVRDLASRPEPADDATLLGVATALLHVEALLDEYTDRFGIGPTAREDATAPPTLTHGEKHHVLVSLMREATANIAAVQDMLVGFVESSWDHSRLAGARERLQEVGGALRMVDAGRPADLIQGIACFIHNELVVARRIPGPGEMDRLADALASVEFHLDACRGQRAGADAMLGTTERMLQQLGYWPVPALRTEDVASAAPEDQREEAPHPDAGAATEPDAAIASVMQDDAPAATEPMIVADMETLATEEVVADADNAASGAAVADASHDDVEAAPVAAPPAPADAAPAPADDAIGSDMAAGFRSDGGEIDDDIREIFLDEVRDEIESITQSLDAWQRAPDDIERVSVIRRSFHTLKGSGRLVGATVLGEFSWKIENMLNRVLDGSVREHAPVRTLVQQATNVLRSLLGALEGTQHPDPALAAVAEAADRLAAGEAATVPDDAVAPSVAAAGSDELSEPLPEGARDESDAQHGHAEEVADSALPEAGSSVPDATVPDDHEDEAANATFLVDPALVEVLRTEVAQHLAGIRADLDMAAGRDLPIQEPLLRAVHTLHAPFQWSTSRHSGTSWPRWKTG